MTATSTGPAPADNHDDCPYGHRCSWYIVAQDQARIINELRATPAPVMTDSAALLEVRAELRRLHEIRARQDARIADLEGRPGAGVGGPVLPHLAGYADIAAGRPQTELDDHLDNVVRSLGLAPHPTVCGRCNGEGVVEYRSLVAPDPKLIHCPDCRCACGKSVVGGGLCPQCEIFDGIAADKAYARSQP